MILLGLLGAALVALFLVWRFRFRYPPDDVPRVLCYHKISDRFCVEGTWTTPGRFASQLDHLIARGYEFIGERQYLDGEPGAKGRQVLLTFDDGYDELFDVYREIIEPRGAALLVFLVSDYVGRENDWELSLGRRRARHMDWDRIRDLSERGVAFGSHGATHRDLTRLSAAQLRHEIEGSRDRIAQELGVVPRTFSYPFGRTNEAVMQAVSEAGYEAAFSLYPPYVNERVERFALRRNGVYIIDTRFTLDCKLTRNPLFWFEEMKCRAINQVAVLTPLLKRVPAVRDR